MDCQFFPDTFPTLSLWITNPSPMDYQTFPCGSPTLTLSITNPFPMDCSHPFYFDMSSKLFSCGLPTLFPDGLPTFLYGQSILTFGLQTFCLCITKPLLMDYKPFPHALPSLSLWMSHPVCFDMSSKLFSCGLPMDYQHFFMDYLPSLWTTDLFPMHYRAFPYGLQAFSLCTTKPFLMENPPLRYEFPTLSYWLLDLWLTALCAG